MKFPTQNSWVSTVLEELVELEISLELEEIDEILNERFKFLIQEKVRTNAF